MIKFSESKLVNIIKVGGIYMTNGIHTAMERNELSKDFVEKCIERYVTYDWGDICEEDNDANATDFENRDGKILAVYKLDKSINYEDKIYIITVFADKDEDSYTTVLFPSEY